MKPFADLLDRLVLTPSRNGKLKLLTDYFRDTPDPDRGYGLAAIAGTLEVRNVKPAMLRELVLERMDEVLFRYSYDYVGDLAETISLVWDNEKDIERSALAQPHLGEVISQMNALGRTEVRSYVRDLLDRLDSSGRFAFIKLATGALRIGVSARLAKQALAELGAKDVTEIETLWHGLEPPYESLFEWLEGRGGKPILATPAIFHSVMLANPVEEGDLANLDPKHYAAEWKWDGIRVQLSRAGDTRKIYSRSGDDISGAFPDILDAISFNGVVDGELLVGGTARSNNPTRTFSDLQQRLNRKTVSGKMLEEYPAFIRAYDLLFDGEEDVRGNIYTERRDRLSEIIEQAPHDRFDLSPLVDFTTWDELDELRSTPPDPVIEGVMIKRRDSIYQAGRLKGPWFKWMPCSCMRSAATASAPAIIPISPSASGPRCPMASSWYPSARPISASPIRSSKCSTSSCATTRPNVSAPSAPCGPTRSSASSSRSPSRASTARPATNPASPCASRVSPACVRTSRATRPTVWKRWWR
jgi:DNA ligase-1